LGAQPGLHGLLDAFDLAAGGGVVWPGVLLHYVHAAQFGLEAVAATLAAGQAGGEHHPVVGQRGGRDAMLGHGGAEAGEHDRAADAPVRADVQQVAGAVIEPGQDLHVATRTAVGLPESVVGDVGLPALVRHRCLG
jgi:hypothetical protein